MKSVIRISAVLLALVASAAFGASIKTRAEYRASSNLTLGTLDPAKGYQIAAEFQLNLVYQAGIDSGDIDALNDYEYPTHLNFPDFDCYYLKVDVGGGLPIGIWPGDDPQQYAADSGESWVQWTLSGWWSGKYHTILAGDIVGGCLRGRPTTSYRSFPGDAWVNDIEVFGGDAVASEIAGYAVSGPIGVGSVLDVSVTHYVPDEYATIQAAINAASPGDTVLVAAGTYNENVTVNKRLTLDGAGSGATGTVITPPSGIGIVVSASGSSASERLVISNLRVTGATSNGINITAANASYLTFENVACVSNTSHGMNTNPPTGSGNFADFLLIDCNLSSNGSTGLRFASYVGINGLTIVNGHMDGNVYGMQFYAGGGSPLVTNVSVSGTTFNNNTSKGMYFENLDNAAFTNVAVSNSGTSGSWAAGVDINLKYHSFQNITFSNCAVTNCGTGDPVNGAGLTIKARDDGSYSGNPATLTNVQITGTTITGCQEGIRFGEPGVNNAGPTNVAVHNCTISGNVLNGIRNVSQALTNAESNWWGDPAGPGPVGPGAGDKVSANVDYDPWLSGPTSGNVLYLLPAPASIYIKPTESAILNMNVANLLQNVNACQAMLGYSSTYLTAVAGCVVAGGGVWDELIYNSWDVGSGVPGEIDTAIGVDAQGAVGTDADGTVAVITLAAAGAEGVTQMIFRPDVSDVESTFLSDMSANPVWPVKLNSLNITIDGTVPTIDIVSAKQGGAELLISLGSTINAVEGTVSIQVTAGDALAGLDGNPVVTVTPNGGSAESATFVNESPTGTFNYTWTITSSTPNGTATINANVSDKAGNTASDSDTFNINKHEITGTVELESLNPATGGITRTVTFVATGGASTKTWNIPVSFAAGSATGTYLLTDVPEGTTNLSAKTAWNLRKKLGVTYVDDRAVADFTGAGKLLGGDLNGSNSINILDYSVMKLNWGNMDPGNVANINGDALGVQLLDYSIMKANWFKVGDAQ